MTDTSPTPSMVSAPPESHPSGAIEVLRRVALLAGLIGALWCAMWPAPATVRVHFEDFEARPPRGWAFREDTRSLEERVDAEVRERLAHAAGPEWTALARAADVAAKGEDPGGAFAGRLDTGWSPSRLWFRADEEPVASVAREMGDDKTFVYVPIPGERVRFLSLTWTRPNWAGDAPGWVLYPHRKFALWAALAGVLAYAFLPRPRFAARDVYVKRFRGTILPDVLGAMLTCAFVALPILVVPANAPDGDWTGGGWIVLWCIGFFMALFGVAIHAVAAWMAVYRVTVLPDRLRRTTLFGTSEMRIADIECVRLRRRKRSGTLVAAGALVSLVNWRAAGPTLLYASRNDLVLEMVPRKGVVPETPFRVDPDYSENLEGMLETLKRAGVPFDDAA